MEMQQQALRALNSAIVLCALWAAGTVAAQTPADAASLAKGKRLFMLCSGCHELKDSGLPKTGPRLNGVVGRPAGSVAGYAYSADMKAQNFVWDEDRLNAWLEKPTAVVPGTAMVFIGLPSATDRKALIDYLRSTK